MQYSITIGWRALTACFILFFLESGSALADTPKLSSTPLVNSTTTQVLPNLMFILDNSGSMDNTYTPDYVGDTSSGSPNALPLSENKKRYLNAGYNAAYYNPTIRYLPAVKYDGSSYPSQVSSQNSTWTAVKNDIFGIQTNYCSDGITNAGPTATCNLVGNAVYYSYIPGEYCTTQQLTDCVAQNAPSATYPYPAGVRWCSSSTAAATTPTPAGACRAVRMTGYTNARIPGSPSTATISVANNSTIDRVTSIKVNGEEILSTPTPINTSDRTAIASAIANGINNCTSAITGSCTVKGYSATSSSGTVTITSPADQGFLTVTPVITKTGSKSITATAFTKGTPGSVVRTDIVSTTSSYTAPGKTTKAAARTDCASTTCTYEEEMTNFANWFTFYRSRMQSMKSSASLAFKNIDNKYRVGFITIANQSSNYLAIDTFNSGAATSQKAKWYAKLFATNPTTSTPLRSALSLVGRIYAGKKPLGNTTGDPVQYSCQQNFSLLTTDGYWNTDNDAAVKNVDSSGSVGNLDGGSTARPMYEGPTASSNSLADTAKYYYDTDIRNASLANCTGALGIDVCEDNVFVNGSDNNTKQHMTTMTLGLGVDGTLLYSSDYDTATSGAFYDIKNGTANWPVPVADTETAVDDLWHAAVNGHGTYFSAKDPTQLTNSLQAALSTLSSKIGSGSAAALSTLSPTAGDNYSYVATYATVKWTGNLEQRTISTSTGLPTSNAIWCAEDVVASQCSSPSYIASDSSGSTTTYYCVTPSSTADSCTTGFLEGTDCKVQVAKACVGTMKSRVSSATDTRTIYMNKNKTLVPFQLDNLTSTQKTYFNATQLANLSQWTNLSTDQQTTAVNNIIPYLRGNYGYEDRSSNPSTNRLFRYREAVLGDISESQPVYVGEAPFNYKDGGYAAYKSTAKSKLNVYVGANDGMLHAFDSATGKELWAFVPTPVLKKMWKLADKNYSSMHTNYVNGDPIVVDVCTAGCSGTGTWRTVLVAGLNGGGRGYYALDVTNPAEPSLLWEFTEENTPNLGYTYGNPVVTKLLENNRWVAVLTSGYNNGRYDADGITDYATNKGTGKGYLYVVDIASGNLLKTIPTTDSLASDTNPSGLGPITPYIESPFRNNLADYVYGGDLHGNVWRFDINAGTVRLFATLKSSSGVAQPITAQPVTATTNNKRMLIVGTGKYVEVGDLTDLTQQSLYGIIDNDDNVILTNARSYLTQQTLSTSGGAKRTGSNNAVNTTTGRGWYIDFPDSGERQVVAGQLIYGTLIIPTTVPSNSVCAPGGYGWLNYLDYETGISALGANAVASSKMNSPVVGFNVIFPPASSSSSTGNFKTAKVVYTGADGSTGSDDSGGALGANGFQANRVIWRQLFTDE